MFLKIWLISVGLSLGINFYVLSKIVINELREGRKITKDTFKLAGNLMGKKSLKRDIIFSFIPIVNIFSALLNNESYTEGKEKLSNELNYFNLLYNEIREGREKLYSLNVECIRVLLGDGFSFREDEHLLTYIEDGIVRTLKYGFSDGLPYILKDEFLEEGEYDILKKGAILRESLKRVAMYLGERSEEEVKSLLADSLTISLKFLPEEKYIPSTSEVEKMVAPRESVSKVEAKTLGNGVKKRVRSR